MPVYHASCNVASRYCTSGCCQSGGSCALFSSNCIYRYSDYYTNPYYYFPGYSNSNCLSTATTCTSGCCTYSGNCAYTFMDCSYRYTDYYTSYGKYYFAD